MDIYKQWFYVVGQRKSVGVEINMLYTKKKLSAAKKKNNQH